MATKILTDTHTGKTITLFPADEYNYGSKKQIELAQYYHAQYAFARKSGRLPAWIYRVLQINGLSVVQIGRTTNVSATFAAYYI